MNWTRTTWIVQRVFHDLKFSRFVLPILVVYLTTWSLSSFLFPLHCLASAEMGQNRRVPLTKSWNLGTALVRGTMSGAIRFRHSKVRYICFRVRSRGRESYWSMGMHYFASWSIQSFLKSSCDFISAVNLGELVNYRPNHWEMTEFNFSCLCFQWAVGFCNCIGKNGYFGEAQKYLND